MFEPFGQLIGLSRSADPAIPNTAPAEPPRLYRLAIGAFWILVVTIVVARIVLASHGGLFAFGS